MTEITHRARMKKQLNGDFVGPFLIWGIVAPDQNQGDWRLSCHFNPSTDVWGCAINNWPWRLPAAGNQIRGKVWGCCPGQGCLKPRSLKTVLLWSTLLSWIWMETGKLNKICKQKCCRTTGFLPCGVAGCVQKSRPGEQHPAGKHSSRNTRLLSPLRHSSHVLVSEKFNHRCLQSGQYKWWFYKCVYLNVKYFIYHFLPHPSPFSLFPSPQPPKHRRIPDCL